MLTLFDLLLVASAAFKVEVPWWLWVIAVIDQISTWIRLERTSDFQEIVQGHLRK